MFIYSITDIQLVAPDITQFILIPQNVPMHYLAGQYVSVLHPDQGVSFLSVACAPQSDHHLEFHVHHPAKNSGALTLLQIANQDKQWQLDGPFGACTVEHLQCDQSIIFIARNTGFASIKAVISALLQQTKHPDIYFYWCVPNEDELYLTNVLSDWMQQGVHFIPIYTKVFSEHSEANQHLVQAILQQHPNIGRYQVYVSGPKKFVTDIFMGLSLKGLLKENFFSDLF